MDHSDHRNRKTVGCEQEMNSPSLLFGSERHQSLSNFFPDRLQEKRVAVPSTDERELNLLPKILADPLHLFDIGSGGRTD